MIIREGERRQKQREQAIPPDGGDLGGFTVSEFAGLFRISRGMVYKEHKAGRIKFVKAGARTIITRTEARRYQTALEVGE
jgi:hypothetical protein